MKFEKGDKVRIKNNKKNPWIVIKVCQIQKDKNTNKSSNTDLFMYHVLNGCEATGARNDQLSMDTLYYMKKNKI